MILDEANNIVKAKLLEIIEKKISNHYKEIERAEGVPNSFKNTLLLFYASVLTSTRYPDIPKEDILRILNKYHF